VRRPEGGLFRSRERVRHGSDCGFARVTVGLIRAVTLLRTLAWWVQLDVIWCMGRLGRRQIRCISGWGRDSRCSCVCQLISREFFFDNCRVGFIGQDARLRRWCAILLWRVTTRLPSIDAVLSIEVQRGFAHDTDVCAEIEAILLGLQRTSMGSKFPPGTSAIAL